MWIVFGTAVKATLVPGGARVARECGQCGEHATFYEKDVTSTFRLYFIDIFDYRRHRVMACGACGACYATDELGLPGARTGAADTSHTLGERAARAAQEAFGYVDRAAGALEAGVSNLLSADRPAALRQPPVEEASRSDDDDDPLEARFRELERKEKMRIKID